MRKQLMFGLVAFGMLSCSSQPSCDDSDVTDLVQDVLMENDPSIIIITSLLGKNNLGYYDMERVYQITALQDKTQMEAMQLEWLLASESMVADKKQLTVDGVIKWHFDHGGKDPSGNLKDILELDKDYQLVRGDSSPKNRTAISRMTIQKLVDDANANSPYLNKVTNIRLYSKDEETKTTICQCEVGTKEYAYSAQYNSEGELFVEVNQNN